MDVSPLHQQPTTNDEELARVLAGANDDQPHDTPTADDDAASGLSFEETSPTDLPAVDSAQQAIPEPPAPLPAPEQHDDLAPEPPAEPETTASGTELPAVSAAPSAVGPLDDLKKSALEELRPLVGKLDLPAEEKFDTLLLIIRSTDDQSLLDPAHEAAKQIADETKRAQALLDIIKEIDYFSQGGTQPAV